MSLPRFETARLAHLDGRGPWSRTVLWSEAELRRSLEGERFPAGMELEDQDRVGRRIVTAARLLPALAEAEPGGFLDSDPAEVLRAREAGLVSTTHRDDHLICGSCLAAPDGGTVLRVLDRDHLVLAVRRSGFDPVAVAREVLAAERKLDRALPFAYDDRFGYLTAEPSRCGTGLVLSCVVHLPALAYSGGAVEALEGFGEAGCRVTPWLEGDGTVHGDLYRIRTTRTLGESEKAMTAAFTRLVADLVGREAAMADVLEESMADELEDRAHRAFGVLTHARRLDCGETLDLLSRLMFAVDRGLLEVPDQAGWRRLLLDVREGHLETAFGTPSDAETSELRAAVVRDFLT